MRVATSLLMGAAFVAACTGSAGAPPPTEAVLVVPTPQIVYVTPEPASVGPLSPAPTAAQSATANEQYVIRGTLHRQGLMDLELDESGVCPGRHQYSYIEDGLPVTALDETGKTIGATSLEPGAFNPVEELACTFDFEFSDVPKTAFYSFKLGTTPSAAFSFADMVANAWRVDLALGDPALPG